METILRISEAASLAMHAMVFLASKPGRPCPVEHIASALHVSEHHLSKVLQRLAKVNLVYSVRGRSGGFTLTIPPDRITLLQVYEAIEGPLNPAYCLLSRPVCHGDPCILGNLLHALHQQVRDYLSGTSVAHLVHVHEG